MANIYLIFFINGKIINADDIFFPATVTITLDEIYINV